MRYRAWHRLFFLALWFWQAFPSGAIDPLPPWMENAPLEAKAKYWDQMGRDSMELRTKVAQQRFDKKMDFQRSVARTVKASSAEHLDRIHQQTVSKPAVVSDNHSWNWAIAAAALLAASLLARRYTTEIADFAASFRPTAGPIPRFAVAGSLDEGADSLWPQTSSGISECQRDTPVDQVPAFPAQAQKSRNEAKKLLEELGWTKDTTVRKRLLADLCGQASSLKSQTGLSQLGPIWQMASALESLLGQLSDKPAIAGPSTLRTVSSAFDVLEELHGSVFSAEMGMNPPIRVLVVDDDALCRLAVTSAVQKSLDKPETAPTGEAALLLATKQRFDVIFLDVEMPGMNGFELCQHIRNTVPNRETPVVFVTNHADTETQSQATRSGGDDFIAKPFLSREITVKALTLALRNRLQHPLDTTTSMPETVSVRVASSLPNSHRDAVGADSTHTQVGSPSLAITSRSETASGISSDLKQSLLEKAPLHLATARKIVDQLVEAARAGSLENRQDKIGELYLSIHLFAADVGRAGLPLTTRLGSALEGLLKKLYENPQNATSSSLNTVHHALSLLKNLCAPGAEEGLADGAPYRILVADDEPLARRAMAGALQLAFDKPDSAEEGAAAFALAAQKPYDVIFLDVQMPGMDGFTLCSKIRDTVPNGATPVVFVTSQADFAARDQAIRSGGSDLIAKPFLPIEIGVKALTYALEGRLYKNYPEHEELRRS